MRAGFNFLYYLENTVVQDRAAFGRYFKAYIARFAYRSLTSQDFRAFFTECVARAHTPRCTTPRGA